MEKVKKGFSMIELLVIVSIIGILFGIGVITAIGLRNPLSEAVNELGSTVRQIRTQAISSTSAYRLKATSATTAVVDYAVGCGAIASGWTLEPKLKINLESGLVFVNSNFSVCFQPRGTVESAISIIIRNDRNLQRTVNVFTAGSITTE